MLTPFESKNAYSETSEPPERHIPLHFQPNSGLFIVQSVRVKPLHSRSALTYSMRVLSMIPPPQYQSGAREGSQRCESRRTSARLCHIG